MPLKILMLSDMRDSILMNRWPRKRGLDFELLRYVEGIIEDVKRRGDLALIDLTAKFDGVNLPTEKLRVSRGEMKEAYSRVDEKQISAIKFLKDRVERFEGEILARIRFEYEDKLGVRIRREYRPIRSVGCYVPGGGASYPSTVVMTTVPAKVAGVPRIVICSPPRKDGEVDPLTLVAADICGVNEFYRVGGAQAIAALAYGTKSIKPVEKIIGPGNRYVLAAKNIVSRDVPIDHPAGPSEIMVLADETANPYYIALDMISQAEHGVDSIAVLVTLSMQVAEKVLENILHLIRRVPNRGVVKDALESNSLILVAESLDEAINFINEFAPEHLEVIADGTREISEKIFSAGMILVGSETPVSLSDYCLGTNHILPTGGFGHAYQSLSVLDFIRCLNIAECTNNALKELSTCAKVLAESEGLLNHALAIEGRTKDWVEKR
ncbi:histidinol dehydrogenase [Candidatus Bathyarchaeota archaeon]|nr:histidinol dehydrogenase [Candidatus Bathyarchaeota archaeon]